MSLVEFTTCAVAIDLRPVRLPDTRYANEYVPYLFPLIYVTNDGSSNRPNCISFFVKCVE